MGLLALHGVSLLLCVWVGDSCFLLSVPMRQGRCALLRYERRLYGKLSYTVGRFALVGLRGVCSKKFRMLALAWRALAAAFAHRMSDAGLLLQCVYVN